MGKTCFHAFKKTNKQHKIHKRTLLFDTCCQITTLHIYEEWSGNSNYPGILRSYMYRINSTFLFKFITMFYAH